MAEAVSRPCIRERLKDLNTKAYYLLVALSFVYRTGHDSRALKLALTLTAIVAVLPVQDYVKSTVCLERIRFVKVVLLIAAMVSTVVWVWHGSG